MKAKNWMLPLVFTGATFAATPALAQTYTWLGSDLPGVATFPAQQPQVVGTSLEFSYSGIAAIHQVVDLPIPALPAGTERVTLRLNLTRLACNVFCSGGAGDYDSIWGLQTGNTLLAGALSDYYGVSDAVIGSQQWTASGIYFSFLNGSNLAPAALPTLGQPWEVSVTYELGASSTTIITTQGANQVSHTAPAVLDPANLRFTYLRDNDTGEQFQINSITVESEGGEQAVAVDIKPSSCPNPLNLGRSGVVSVAISGGDVAIGDIDPASVRLAGVEALRWSEEDLATPYQPVTGKALTRLACTTAGGDGSADLVLKFDADALAAALGGANLIDGQVVRVPLTGALRSGGSIVGEDIMWVRAGN